MPDSVKGSAPAADQVRLAVRGRLQAAADAVDGDRERARIQEAGRRGRRSASSRENLRELLLASPLGQKRVLAIDPGFRTGCKTVVLDRPGQARCTTTSSIRPAGADTQTCEAARRRSRHSIEKHRGRGHRDRQRHGRPRDGNLRPQARACPRSIPSRHGQRERRVDLLRVRRRPRGVSRPRHHRARRRLDRPAADGSARRAGEDRPKSIGVGQYQHDVDQDALKTVLDDVVVSCVNGVGVEVNTASQATARLRLRARTRPSPRTSSRYRDENGPFKSRARLAARCRASARRRSSRRPGFLRIRDGAASAGRQRRPPGALSAGRADGRATSAAPCATCMRDAGLRARRSTCRNTSATRSACRRCKDILAELAKPGRDPRAADSRRSHSPKASRKWRTSRPA